MLIQEETISGFTLRMLDRIRSKLVRWNWPEMPAAEG